MTTKFKPLHLADFTGGLNTANPSSEININESPDLDNITLMDKGFKKRQGDSAFCTAMNLGVNVQGIGYYQPISATKYLMAITGDKIYKSDALDGTMDDITDVVSITANQNNIWTHTVFNDLSIFVGGAPDAPIKWAGTGNAAVLGGSPVSGSFGFQTRDRMYICAPIADPSTVYWSVISNPEDWSGTGSGSATIETDDGDKLITAIPLNNDVVLFFKQYSIHMAVTSPSITLIKPLVKGIGCCGKHAVCNVNGLIYFVGMDARLYVTDGYTINLVEPSGKINNIWDTLNKSRLTYIVILHDKVRNLIIVYCSYNTSTYNNYAIAWDLERKCWLRFTTGYKANVACIVDGYRHFVGAYDGVIYERDKANIYADASETSPGIIKAYYYTPWLKGQSNDTILNPHTLTINYATQTVGDVKYAYGFNYNKDVKTGTISTLQVGGKWDIDTWDDTFIWGGQSDSQKKNFIYGRGNNFIVKIYNDILDQPMEINSFSLLVKEQGIKEITNV